MSERAVLAMRLKEEVDQPPSSPPLESPCPWLWEGQRRRYEFAIECRQPGSYEGVSGRDSKTYCKSGTAERLCGLGERSGFEQFAAFDQDAIDNKAFVADGKLDVPVLTFGGE